jgi:DNA-binding CsgD family transcriptional regulator/tetratricopeptide (TPR) repeat protein
MVGRERELDELRTVAARVLEREPSTAVVIGEAGVGKSRLVSELVAELGHQGWICAASHGVELAGGEIPLGAAAEMLRSLVRAVGVEEVRRAAGHEAQVLAAVLPALGRTGDTPPVDRAEVVGAVLTLFETLNRPVCWVLDDLQWMDDATCDLATYLSRVLADASVLLLATVRTKPDAPGDLPPELAGIGRAGTVVTLGPLGPQAVAAQVAAIPGHHLGARQVARICEVSDGLPFFVEQLVMSDGRVTGSLRSVVLAGFQTLTPEARKLLSAAAVGEGILVPRFLRMVSGLGASFGPALDELRERGLLRPDHEGELLAFRHALLRETVDSSMLSDERRELHRIWGDVLETGLMATPGDPRLVMERARHRYAVGGDDAFPAVLAAARAAELADDDEVRARWWERAFELWPPHGASGPSDLERDRALHHYVEALWSIGRPRVAAEILEWELAGETDFLRTLWLRVSRHQLLRALQATHKPPVPPEQAEDTMARLRSLQPDFRVTWLLIRLADDWMAEHPRLAVEMLEDALRRADPDTDATVVQEAYSLLGFHECVRGDANNGVERMQQALEWTRRHHPPGLVPARVHLSGSLVNAGRYAEAIELAEEILREIRDPRTRPTLWVVQQLTLATATLFSCDWARTAECLTRADTPACRGMLASSRDSLAATLAARLGDVERAEVHLKNIPDPPPDAPIGLQGSPDGIAKALASLEVNAARGDVEACRTNCLQVDTLTHAEDPPDDVWEAGVRGLRVGVGRAADDEATEAFFAALTDALSSRHVTGRLAAACRSEIDAHVGRTSDADTAPRWAHAASLWTELGRAYDAAWCRVFEAECAARDGERARATKALEQARAVADRLGAVPLGERIRTAARRWRIDGVARAKRAAGLTSRELEVVGLLAEGLTNAQIAERLYMSPKTASVHVSHVIAKLGVANRTQAAAVAHRKGLLGMPPGGS